MALAKPPAWDTIEQDERFKALTPELKLQTLNNWSGAARKYGLESGSFNDPVQRKAYTDLIDTKRAEYTAPPAPEIGTLEGIANSAANAWDSGRQSFMALGGVSPGEAQTMAKLEYSKAARQAAPGYKAYQEAEGWDAVKAFATNPIEVTANIVAEGMAGSALSLATGAATGAAAAAALSPTVVGAPVGYTLGQIGGTFAGSLATEYGSKILEELQNAGMDMKNPESITKFFSNEELVSNARAKGLARGIPVALFDAVAAGVGGRVGSIVKAAAKAPVGSVARRTVESMAVKSLTSTPTRLIGTEVALQGLSGGAGEIAGSLVAGDDIKWKDVFAEVVGELGPGALEIAQGSITSKKAEAKADQDRVVTQAERIADNLNQNNSPLTAAAVQNNARQQAQSDEERLRDLTLEGEQVPVSGKPPAAATTPLASTTAATTTASPAAVAAPKVPDVYKPENLKGLAITEIVQRGKALGDLIQMLDTQINEATDPSIISQKTSLRSQALGAVANLIAELKRRKGEQKAAATPPPIAGTPVEQGTVPPGTSAGTVAFAAGQEAKGGVQFAPKVDLEVKPSVPATTAAASIPSNYVLPTIYTPESLAGMEVGDIEKHLGSVTRNLTEIDDRLETETDADTANNLGKLRAVVLQAVNNLTQEWQRKRETKEAVGTTVAPPAAPATEGAAGIVGLPAELRETEDVRQEDGEPISASPEYLPESLVNFSDERIVSSGKDIGETIAKIDADLQAGVNPDLARTLNRMKSVMQLSLDNLREEWRRRNKKPVAVSGELPKGGTAAPIGLLSQEDRAKLAAEREATFGGLPKQDALRKFVEKTMRQSSAANVIDIFKQNGILPADAKTLADVKNVGAVMAWLKENGFDKMGGASMPAFIRDKQQTGGLTEFTTEAGLPLFQAAATGPAQQQQGQGAEQAPAGEKIQPDIESPEGKMGGGFTDAVAGNRRKVEAFVEELPLGEYTVHTDPDDANGTGVLTIRLNKKGERTYLWESTGGDIIGDFKTVVSALMWGRATDANGQVFWDRGYLTRKAAPAQGQESQQQARGQAGQSPAATTPATGDEAFNRAQERLARIRAEREQISERLRQKRAQATMGADPETAWLGVQLAINYAKEGVVRFSDWSARVSSELPEIWESIKDYAKDIWIKASEQVQGLEKLQEFKAAEGELPLVEATAGERPAVTLTPPVITEAPVGGIAGYRRNLVEEARNLGLRTVRRTFREVEDDVKKAGWRGGGGMQRKQFVRSIIDRANQELRENVQYPSSVFPGSKQEQVIYDDTRKNQAVPTMATIVGRLAVEETQEGEKQAIPGRSRRELKERRNKIQVDDDTYNYLAQLREVQRNSETQLATDLGLTNPATIRFTEDLEGKLKIPNRVVFTVVEPGSILGVKKSKLKLVKPKPNASLETVQSIIQANRINIRAFLATLPDGTYEIVGPYGLEGGTIIVNRKADVGTAVSPPTRESSLKVTKIQKLIDKYNEVETELQLLMDRRDFGNLGEPIEKTERAEVRSRKPGWYNAVVKTKNGRVGTVVTDVSDGSVTVQFEKPAIFKREGAWVHRTENQTIPVKELLVVSPGYEKASGQLAPRVESNLLEELNSRIDELRDRSERLSEKVNDLLRENKKTVVETVRENTGEALIPEMVSTAKDENRSISDYVTYLDAGGNEQFLYDAIEKLSGRVEESLEDVFVNDSEIAARQLDQGKTVVVPVENRDNVAPGIEFNPDTGVITSAVSGVNGGTKVTGHGQLTAAAEEERTIMDTDFSPIPEELVNVADIVEGITRRPKTGEVLTTLSKPPMTPEQRKMVEVASRVLSTMQSNANVDEDRAAYVGLVIYADAVRRGVYSLTPRRAFYQAVRKLLDRQQYRPQLLSSALGIRSDEFISPKPSVASMLEEFEGAKEEGFKEEGYSEEPSVNVMSSTSRMLDMEELIYRQVSLRQARQIASENISSKTAVGLERYLVEHVKEMLTLRRKLAKDGKLKGFTQQEISAFTMSVLNDLNKRPLAKGEDAKNLYTSNPDVAESVDTAENAPTKEEQIRALKLVVGVITKFYPGIREILVSDGRGRMHISDRLPNSLFVNPERVARVIKNMSDEQASSFIRLSGLHEYYHLGLLKKLGISGLREVGNNLTETQLQEAAEMYHSQSSFESEEARSASFEEFKSDRVGAAMEYLTMLAERMKNGQSVQEMPELSGMPQGILKRILSAIKAIWRRLETHARMYANPSIGEKLENLREGVRELDQMVYGESVYPEQNVELRVAPEEYSGRVGNIFDSYKSDKGDSAKKKVYTVSIGNGYKPMQTMATSESRALSNVLVRILRDSKAGTVFINGKELNTVRAAYSALTEFGNVRASKFARPVDLQSGKTSVPKAEQTMAEGVSEVAKQEGLQQGTFDFYSMTPDTRVRVGTIGQGSFWNNLKAALTGRYSETRKLTGGKLSSGKFTPEQREVRLAQAQKVNAAMAKAEFLSKKYQRVLKKLYKNNADIPIDTLNAALGSTDNRYTNDQWKQLKNAPDEATRAQLVLKFTDENIKSARTRIEAARNSLPKELASVVQEMRDTIDSLSKELIDGNYASKKIKIIADKNRGVYLHRSYQIYDNPLWKKYMQNPIPGSEHEKIVNAAEKFFSMWAKADVAREIRNEAAKGGTTISVDDSLKMAATMGDDIANKAHNMMVDYLSVADDSQNNFLSTGKLPGQQKKSIIMERGQIPKEIRDLWGEISDNEINFAKTVSDMAGFMAARDTAKQLLNIGLSEGYMWKPGVSKGMSAPAGFSRLYPAGTLADDNPLHDVFAPKEVRDAFRELRDSNTAKGWAKWFMGLTSWTMAMKTLGNFPQGYIRNFLGNPLLVINGGFIGMRDIINPMRTMRIVKLAMRSALSNTGLSFDDGIQALREEYIRKGIVGESLEGGLLEEMVVSKLNEPGIARLWKDRTAAGTLGGAKVLAKSAGNTVFKKAADLYQSVDEFWKVFAYEQEKKFQREANPTWTEEQVQDEAARRVRDKLPTYSLSPEVTKKLRGMPFIAPFITWTSEVLRTGANTLGIALEDIRKGYETNNTAMQKNGLRSLVGIAFSASIIPTMVAVSKSMNKYDEEDDDAMRKFVPDFEKNDQLVYMGQRKDGKVGYINFSYLDPQQMRAETFIALGRALREGKSLSESVTLAGSQMIRPVVSEQLFASALVDLMRNRTPQGASIWNEQDTAANILAAKLQYAASALAPGIVSGAGRRIYKSLTGEVSKQGKSYHLENELSGIIFGQRMGEVDVQTVFGNLTRSFLNDVAESKRLLTSVTNSRGTVNLEDIGPAYANAVESHRKLFEEMSRVFNSALRLGVPRTTAIKILKDTLSDNDAMAIASGRVPKFVLSPTALETVVRNAPTRQEGLARRSKLLEVAAAYNKNSE